MEELDINQLDEIAGGRQIYQKNSIDICSVCGKKSESGDSPFGENFFGMGFASVFDEKGGHKLCPSCYEKWCNEKFKNF